MLFPRHIQGFMIIVKTISTSPLKPFFPFFISCTGHGRWERRVWSWVWLVVLGCVYVWNAFWWNSILRRIFGGNLQQNYEPHCKFLKFSKLLPFAPKLRTSLCKFSNTTKLNVIWCASLNKIGIKGTYS